VSLQVEHAPALTDRLRAELVAVWVAATNAGGALGLVAPTDAAAAEVLAEPLWRRLHDGLDDLVVGRVDDRLAGWFVLESRTGPLSPHWRTVKRLQVHPALQGRGHGRALLAEAASVARRLGLEALHLTVRGGTGIERFYLAHGYREVGRLPRALRLGPGDDRDEIHLHLDLRPANGRGGGAPRASD
jgi:GNAT superfamily N-acetyltransferase